MANLTPTQLRTDILERITNDISQDFEYTFDNNHLTITIDYTADDGAYDLTIVDNINMEITGGTNLSLDTTQLILWFIINDLYDVETRKEKNTTPEIS